MRTLLGECGNVPIFIYTLAYLDNQVVRLEASDRILLRRTYLVNTG
jgi:hypothetical protein